MEIKQYTPAEPSPDALLAGLTSGRYQHQADGLYKLCSRCQEYWPADSQFFGMIPKGDGIDNTCRACYYERRYPNGRKGAKACQ